MEPKAERLYDRASRAVLAVAILAGVAAGVAFRASDGWPIPSAVIGAAVVMAVAFFVLLPVVAGLGVIFRATRR